jgi:alanine-alpha-ketoisovalerate/valine-pyruvate aminotransferase
MAQSPAFSLGGGQPALVWLKEIAAKSSIIVFHGETIIILWTWLQSIPKKTSKSYT